MEKKVHRKVTGGLPPAKGKRSVSQKPVVKASRGGISLHQKLARGQKV